MADLGRDILELLDDAENNEAVVDAACAAIEACRDEDLDPDDPADTIERLNAQLVGIRQMAAAYGLPVTDLPGAIEMLAMGCGFEKVKKTNGRLR